MPSKIRANLPFNLNIDLPTKSFTEEVWLNLTSPLKRQLKSPAVVDFNDSSLIESVNALRWDSLAGGQQMLIIGVARVAGILILILQEEQQSVLSVVAVRHAQQHTHGKN